MATNGTNGNGESVTGTGQEKINLDIVTLTRFLTEEQTKHKEATGDFTCTESSQLLQHPLIHLQSPLPRPAILLQVHLLLHSPSHLDQPHGPRWLLQHDW